MRALYTYNSPLFTNYFSKRSIKLTHHKISIDEMNEEFNVHTKRPFANLSKRPFLFYYLSLFTFTAQPILAPKPPQITTIPISITILELTLITYPTVRQCF